MELPSNISGFISELCSICPYQESSSIALPHLFSTSLRQLTLLVTFSFLQTPFLPQWASCLPVFYFLVDYFFDLLIGFFALFSQSSVSHSAGDSTHTQSSVPLQFCYRKTWDLGFNDSSTFSEFMVIKRKTFCLLKYYSL